MLPTKKTATSGIAESMMHKFTFGIVDDHLILRDVVRRVCLETPGARVVLDVGTGADAVEGIIRIRPETLILDIGLPDFDGCEVLYRIHSHGVRPRVLVLSGHCNPYLVYRLAQLEIHGFVDKTKNTMSNLRLGLADIQMNRTHFSDSFVEIQKKRNGDAMAFDKLLTNQQILVLSLVAHHLNDQRISDYLKISERTVENHRTEIMRKLGLHSRVDLMRFADDQGFSVGSPPSLGAIALRGGC
jgi:DNA-binding NarL/FixJ family response regulator